MKEENVRRVKRLELRLSEEELKKVEEGAKNAGLGLSEFVRSRACGNGGSVAVAPRACVVKAYPKPEEPWDGITNPVARATAEYDARVAGRR